MKAVISLLAGVFCCCAALAQEEAPQGVPHCHILNSDGCPVLLVEETLFRGDGFFRNDGECGTWLVVGKVLGCIGVDVRPGTVVLLEKQGAPELQPARCCRPQLFIAQYNRELATPLNAERSVIYVDGVDFTCIGAAPLLRYPREMLKPGWAELQRIVYERLNPEIPLAEKMPDFQPGSTELSQQLFAAAGQVQSKPDYGSLATRVAPLVMSLIDAGAEVNARCNKEGMTPLMNAALHNNAAACRLLLRAGADANMRDIYGRTALHYALRSLPALIRHPDALSALLAWGGTRADIPCSTPAEYAARFGLADTALHYAVLLNKEDAVRLLLRYGADPAARDHAGRAPAELARQRGASPVIIKMLQEAQSSASGK